MSLKLCECGCGNFTKLASKTSTKRGWKKGEPLRFINGHNANKSIREYKRNMIDRSCVICGKNYQVWPSRKGSTTCSTECQYIKTSNDQKAKQGNLRMTSGGYIQIKIDNHPHTDSDGYLMLHRYIVELYHGKPVHSSYDVHHIDEDKLNNKINNLVIINRSTHMRLHALKRGWGK